MSVVAVVLRRVGVGGATWGRDAVIQATAARATTTVTPPATIQGLADADEATRPVACPHSGQNFTPALISLPHDRQLFLRVAPQLLQNLPVAA